MANKEENKNLTQEEKEAAKAKAKAEKEAAKAKAEAEAATTAQSGSEESEEEKPKSKKIEVDASVLEKMQQEIARLTAAADLNRLAKFDAEQSRKNQLIKKAKVSFWKDKAVVATRTVKDEVFIDGRGIYHETQLIEVITEGDEREEVTLIDYTRNVRKVFGEIVSETKDIDGNTILKMRLPDGKLLDIDNKFVN